DCNRFHLAAAVGTAVAGLHVYMQTPQTFRTMIAVLRARRVAACDFMAMTTGKRRRGLAVSQVPAEIVSWHWSSTPRYFSSSAFHVGWRRRRREHPRRCKRVSARPHGTWEVSGTSGRERAEAWVVGSKDSHQSPPFRMRPKHNS